MKIKNSEFIISAVKPAQYPSDGLKQIVLVGKSNVGKSSFINAVCNRKNMAKTSSTPGKTRLINFYKIQSDIDNFYFVDLPGYGYSKMSKEEQVKVGSFIEEYLQKCKDIGLVIFLVDIRHSPTKDDKLMYDYIIKNELPCVVVTTKADKIAVTKVDGEVKKIQEQLNPLKDLTFLPFSTERKIYTEQILELIGDSISC